MTRAGHLVLLVDDDAPALMLLRNLVREFLPDCECIACLDVATAIDVLREKGPFDLVITDLHFKYGRSGYELVETIRSGGTACPGGTPAKVPVIALSGEPLTETESAPFEFAAQKPYEVLRLIGAVAATLGRHSPRPA